ncbi:MAG: T9SS type A sorting domain-containing protein [bacterium]
MKRLLQILVVLLLSIVFISSLANAVDNDEAQLRKDLPKLLGSSNQGTEFYMTFHPCWETPSKADACKIYITSSVATRVTVEIPARKIHIERTTIPNDIIEISLIPDDAQCYRKTNRDKPYPQQVFKGHGIIVTADDPVICYGVTRFEYTSDGYLAIPKSALGKNYVVASYNDPCQDNGSQYLTSYTSIVGVYNKTEVNVKLGGRVSNYTPGANPMKTGESRLDTLDRGDVWLIGVMGDYNDLTGTTVQANKSVSVISGNFCAYVPINIAACDFIMEQDLPMETWGTKYHVTPILKRLKAPIIRIFASEPNTIIYRDGNEWSLVKGVGGQEGTGYLEMRTIDNADPIRPVVVSAKNRIAITQYNSGQSDDGISIDPFQMALIPIEQYQNSFLFCIPGVNGGSSFKENFLNLCYKSDIDGRIPEDIEFGKASNGVLNWRKLKTVVGNPGQEFIDSSITDGRKYRTLTIALEDPAGVYSLRGNNPMMGYMYGFDPFDSYGFPVTGGFHDLSKPDIWAPVPIYTIDCKWHIEGRITDQPEKNSDLRSNLADLRLVKSESFNFADLVYDKSKFFPGETYAALWSLDIIDSENDGKAVLEFADRAGNDTTITIDYQRTKFSIKNRIENWGVVNPNDSAKFRDFKLVNESAKAVIVDSLLLLSSEKAKNWAYNGFKLDSSIYKEYGGIIPGYSIQPGEELSFRVSFDPRSVSKEIEAGQNQFLDSIGVKAYWLDDVNSFCYFKYKGAVKCALGTPCIAVDKINFGPEIIGNNVSKSFSITNSGLLDLTITGYTITSGIETGIYETNLGVIDLANQLVIPAGASKEFIVNFNPKALGQFSDKIEFISDADTSCQYNDSILEIGGEGINLTITPFADLYIEENTSTSIAFSLNSDKTNAVKIIKESSDEELIPIDSILVERNGFNGNIKITPIQNKTGFCFLTITATNYEVSASKKFKVTVSKAGIVEDNTIAGNDITITPNPVKTNFSIGSATLIIQEVTIYDISGVAVLQTENLQNIDISNFTAGVYYCVIKSNGNSYSKKFEIIR